MQDPKVTIITATYNLIKNNRKDYFIQALESVRNQTYQNIEHLIVDGASDDGTVELLEEYQQKGWITYCSEKDDGIYDAFNKGIEKAKGKYIVFLNSDDYYCDNSGIEKSVDWLEKTNAAFSYANAYRLCDGNMQLCKADLNNIFYSCPFFHLTMLTSKEVLCEMGKFNTKFAIAADYNLILKCFLKKYKSVFVPCCLGVYRAGGFSSLDVEKTEKDRQNAMADAFKPYKITEKEVEALSSNHIPMRLMCLVVNTLGVKFVLRFIFNKISNFVLADGHRKIIQFRFSKNKKYFRLFGIDLLGK